MHNEPMTTTQQQPSNYNATIYCLNEDGSVLSTSVGQVDDEGFILRGNAIQFTGLEGTRAYDERFRSQWTAEHGVRIERDDCAGYKRVLTGLALPPAYTEA